MLGGLGKNSNLLGSAHFNLENTLLFNATGKGGFKGLGFGFQKEFLPKPLKQFNIRRGKFLMRFSHAQHSLNLTFTNDFKFGRIFNGQGTDSGSTGSLEISFSSINSNHSAQLLGIGLTLFTPQADHSKTPTNPINSDDGRKNVWYTKAPNSTLFYANAYAFGSYQSQYFTGTLHLGLNSKKLGAYIQNKLHDGIGLNPRFPWPVTTKNKLYIELNSSINIHIDND